MMLKQTTSPLDTARPAMQPLAADALRHVTGAPGGVGGSGAPASIGGVGGSGAPQSIGGIGGSGSPRSIGGIGGSG